LFQTRGPAVVQYNQCTPFSMAILVRSVKCKSFRRCCKLVNMLQHLLVIGKSYRSDEQSSCHLSSQLISRLLPSHKAAQTAVNRCMASEEVGAGVQVDPKRSRSNLVEVTRGYDEPGRCLTPVPQPDNRLRVKWETLSRWV